MTENRDVQNMLGDMTSADYAELAEARFEESLVNLLFRHYKLSNRDKLRMAKDYAGQYGPSRLTLMMFQERFPDFPVYLTAKTFRRVREDSPVHKLFTSFADRQFTKAYLKLSEELADDIGTHALIFNWPLLGSRKGLINEKTPAMAIHNRRRQYDEPGVQLQWTPPAAGDADQSPLFLEPFTKLLAAIDQDCPGGMWQPDV